MDGIYWNIAETNVGGENGRNELIIEESESEKELCWSCEGSSGPLDGCLHLHSWSQTIRSGHLTLSDPRKSLKILETLKKFKIPENLKKVLENPQMLNTNNQVGSFDTSFTCRSENITPYFQRPLYFDMSFDQSNAPIKPHTQFFFPRQQDHSIQLDTNFFDIPINLELWPSQQL